MTPLKPASKPLPKLSSLAPKKTVPVSQMQGPRAGYTANTFNTGLPTSGKTTTPASTGFNKAFTKSMNPLSGSVPLTLKAPVAAAGIFSKLLSQPSKGQTNVSSGQKSGSYGTQSAVAPTPAIPTLAPLATPTNPPTSQTSFTSYPVDNGTSYNTTAGSQTPQSPQTPSPAATETPVVATGTPQEDPLTKMREAYLKTYSPTEQEMSAQGAIDKLIARQAEIDAQAGLGMTNIEDQTIPMGFITGQQAALERRRTALQGAEQAKLTPLQTQLANMQAQRLAQQQMVEKQLGFATPTTEKVGDSLVQFDPITGTYKSVYSAPTPPGSTADNFKVVGGQIYDTVSGKFFTPPSSGVEPMTAYQAAQLQLERDKLSQKTSNPTYSVDQAKARQFAVSADNANKTLASVNYDPGLVESSLVPNALKSKDRQQFEQASRAFVNSVLRRESGATITDDEFKNKFKELIPQAGDKADVKAQKALARASAVKSIQEAGLISGQIPQSDIQEYMTEYGVDEASARESIQYYMNQGTYNPSFNNVGSDTNKAVSINIPKSSKLAYVNNNPGNLRFIGQQGAAQGQGGFAKFSSPQAGYQALIQDIEAKKAPGGNLGPQSTLAQFVNVYAPPSENATHTYISQMAQWLGVNPNTPISQINTQALAKVIAKKESSTNIA